MMNCYYCYYYYYYYYYYYNTARLVVGAEEDDADERPVARRERVQVDAALGPRAARRRDNI